MAKSIYPNLSAEMSRGKLNITELAAGLGLTDATLRNRINGRSEFTFREAKTLERIFYPLKAEYLLFDGNVIPKVLDKDEEE